MITKPDKISETVKRTIYKKQFLDKLTSKTAFDAIVADQQVENLQDIYLMVYDLLTSRQITPIIFHSHYPIKEHE